jgi:hypothetical protein
MDITLRYATPDQIKKTGVPPCGANQFHPARQFVLSQCPVMNIDLLGTVLDDDSITVDIVD